MAFAAARCTSLVGMGASDAGDAARLEVAADGDAADVASSCPPGAGAMAGTIDEARSQQAPRDPRLPRFVMEGATPGEGGSVYVFGYMRGCVTAASAPDAVVARLDADGRVDPTFGVQGRVCLHRADATGDLDSAFYALARDPRGGVVVAGLQHRLDRVPSGLVLRLDANGRPDPSFGRDGVREYFASGEGHGGTVFYDVAVDSRGIVLAGGDNHPFTQNTYGLVLRVRDDGTPDPAFNGGAAFIDLTTEVFSALAVVDGGYAVAGSSRVTRRARVVRLDAGGTPVPSFGDRGTATSNGRGVLVRGLVVAPDGGFVVGGPLVDPGDLPWRLALQRFDRDGRQDETFGQQGTYVGTQVWDPGYLRRPVMTAQCDGSIVVASHGSTDMELTRVAPSGRLDTHFGESGVADLGTLGLLRAAFVDPADGTITVVGVRNDRDWEMGYRVGLWRVRP